MKPDPLHNSWDFACHRATIVAHRVPVYRSRDHIVYTWHGPTTWPVMISDYGHGTPVKDLPWPMVLIEERWDMGGGLYCRADGWNRAWALWNKAKYAARWRLRLVYSRAIMTLYVWSLAYVDEAAVPSWRDIGRRTPFDGGGHHAPVVHLGRLLRAAGHLAGRLRRRPTQSHR